MTRLFSKLALVALLAGGIAGQAQAGTVWHFPYKGAPYATTTPDDTILRQEAPAPKNHRHHAVAHHKQVYR